MRHSPLIVVIMPGRRRPPSDRFAAAEAAGRSQDPAIVVDRYLTVVAINRSATRIASRLSVGTNLPHSAFHGRLRELVPADNRTLAMQVAHALRRSLDRCGEDDEFLSLIGRLSVLGDGFAAAWAGTDAPMHTWVIEVSVEGTGDIALDPREFVTTDGSGDVLLVWQPTDDASAERLHRLVRIS